MFLMFPKDIKLSITHLAIKEEINTSYIKEVIFELFSSSEQAINELCTNSLGKLSCEAY